MTDIANVGQIVTILMLAYGLFQSFSTKKEAKEQREATKVVTDQIADDLADHRKVTSEKLDEIAEAVSEVKTETRLTNGSVVTLKAAKDDHETRIRTLEKSPAPKRPRSSR